MINYFAIALTHGLLALAAWRLLARRDLDEEGADSASRRTKPWLKNRTTPPTGDGTAPGDA